MWKSIFMYALLAVSYFGFSTIPFTEVNAQTIQVISGDGQSTTRGQKFENGVKFRLTASNGNAITGAQIVFRPDEKQNAETSATADGTFGRRELDTFTDSKGEVTIYVKAAADSLHDTCIIKAEHFISQTESVSANFTGIITDVLNFPSETTTRNVEEGTAANTNIGAPVSATHWANVDTDTTNDVTVIYRMGGSSASFLSIDASTGQLKLKTSLPQQPLSDYPITVMAEEKDGGVVRSRASIEVTIYVFPPGELPPPLSPPPVNPPPSVNPPSPVNPPPAEDTLPLVSSDPVETTGLTVKRIGNPTTLLSWTLPTSINAAAITEYQYSIDGGKTWTSTRSTDTSITLKGDRVHTLSRNKFQIRAVSLNAAGTARVVTAVISARRNIIQDCPVGWVRSDGFAGRNRRALLYEVKVDMDIRDPVSIYKPTWVAIYVHPDEGLETLDGWKLQVALPYNRHREYLLTTENSVIVDAGFVEGGFAFIVPPKASSFPMTGMGFPGSPSPGFDYRLYDDQGRRVDFGISCYKRFDIFQVLKDAEDPRVLRQVHLETYDWNTPYLRSEWTVPTPVPAAPSQVKKPVVGTWADLKKQ